MRRAVGSNHGRAVVELLQACRRADGTLDPDRLAGAFGTVRDLLEQAGPLDAEAYVALADELAALAQELARARASLRDELEALERVRKARFSYSARASQAAASKENG